MTLLATFKSEYLNNQVSKRFYLNFIQKAVMSASLGARLKEYSNEGNMTKVGQCMKEISQNKKAIFKSELILFAEIEAMSVNIAKSQCIDIVVDWVKIADMIAR